MAAMKRSPAPGDADKRIAHSVDRWFTVHVPCR